MAFRISKPDRPIPFAEYVDYLRQRRAAVGEFNMPRDTGDRRTASKRALLKAIEDLGGAW